jgi:hypothetical protein
MSAIPPSPLVIEQRIRNRLMEWLEMVVSYQADPPPFDLNEVLNQWEDWSAPCTSYPAPTYTSGEAEKLLLVAYAWQKFCDATPDAIADEGEAFGTAEWSALVLACQGALAALQLRGRLSDEIEAD